MQKEEPWHFLIVSLRLVFYFQQGCFSWPLELGCSPKCSCWAESPGVHCANKQSLTVQLLLIKKTYKLKENKWALTPQGVSNCRFLNPWMSNPRAMQAHLCFFVPWTKCFTGTLAHVPKFLCTPEQLFGSCIVCQVLPCLLLLSHYISAMVILFP